MADEPVHADHEIVIDRQFLDVTDIDIAHPGNP